MEPKGEGKRGGVGRGRGKWKEKELGKRKIRDREERHKDDCQSAGKRTVLNERDDSQRSEIQKKDRRMKKWREDQDEEKSEKP